MSFIPYGKQDINEDDINNVIKVLKSDFITQGPTLIEFENLVKDYCGADYAFTANSATSSLHLACLALGVGPSDRLWTSPISFVASSNCALYTGAKVDFVDIDPETYNLCPIKLEEKLIQAEKTGRLPKVVIPVHFGGASCDMDRIFSLSKKYDFKIIEDASHAIGAKYKGRPVGSCEYSDISVFSFHPVKIITTGEGGICTTNSKEIARNIELYRSHGVTRNPQLLKKSQAEPWYYEQLVLGFNYRMSDLQAALGVTQMKRLDHFVEKRNLLAKHYQKLFNGHPIKYQKVKTDCASSYHLFVVELLECSKFRREIFNHMRENNVGVNVHYIPIHTQPYYQNLGFKSGDFPNAEKYYNRCLTLPLYPDLTESQQDAIHQLLTTIMDQVCQS